MSQSSNTTAVLDSEKVDRLLAEPSGKARAEAAAGIAAEFSKGRLSERERKLAESILEIMSADIHREVRESISEHVKHCPFLPSSIAHALARDVASVALPIIQFSEVLNDAELIAIARGGNEARQVAVAKRRTVSQKVADSLVDTQRRRVVGALLANQGADVSEPSLHKVLDTFDKDEDIEALLVDRQALPLPVTERLVTRLSDELRQRLVSQHGLPEKFADHIALHGRERALSRIVAKDERVAEIETLVERLHATGKLSPTLLLRSLCIGDVHFFEAGLARLAGVPIDSARTLLYDDGSLGLQELYQRARLPRPLFRAFRVAIDVVIDVRRNEATVWQHSHTQTIIDHLVREYREICPNDIEHVLSQLSRHIEGQATDGASPAV